MYAHEQHSVGARVCYSEAEMPMHVSRDKGQSQTAIHSVLIFLKRVEN